MTPRRLSRSDLALAGHEVSISRSLKLLGSASLVSAAWCSTARPAQPKRCRLVSDGPYVSELSVASVEVLAAISWTAVGDNHIDAVAFRTPPIALSRLW